MARELHMCKKRKLKLGECSDCSELESLIEQVRQDLETCCTDADNRLTAIEDIIGDLESISIEVVQSLPQTGESGVIYLVPKQDSSQNDTKDEYIWVGNTWEKIGSTDIDLTNYVERTEWQQVNDHLEDDIDTLDGKLTQMENDLSLAIVGIGDIQDEMPGLRSDIHDRVYDIYFQGSSIVERNNDYPTASLDDIVDTLATKDELQDMADEWTAAFDDMQCKLEPMAQDSYSIDPAPANSVSSYDIYTAQRDEFFIGYLICRIYIDTTQETDPWDQRLNVDRIGINSGTEEIVRDQVTALPGGVNTCDMTVPINTFLNQDDNLHVDIEVVTPSSSNDLRIDLMWGGATTQIILPPAP